MKIAEFYHFKPILIVIILLCLVSSCYSAGTMRGIHLDRIQLPPGFKIRLYAAEVPHARSLTMSPKGVLFVGTRQAGKIYAVLDTDQDHVADEVITIAEGLNMPNGVDILVMPAGALLVSDDRAGVIYRIAYGD